MSSNFPNRVPAVSFAETEPQFRFFKKKNQLIPLEERALSNLMKDLGTAFDRKCVWKSQYLLWPLGSPDEVSKMEDPVDSGPAGFTSD